MRMKTFVPVAMMVIGLLAWQGWLAQPPAHAQGTVRSLHLRTKPLRDLQADKPPFHMTAELRQVDPLNNFQKDQIALVQADIARKIAQLRQLEHYKTLALLNPRQRQQYILAVRAAQQPPAAQPNAKPQNNPPAHPLAGHPKDRPAQPQRPDLPPGGHDAGSQP